MESPWQAKRCLCTGIAVVAAYCLVLAAYGFAKDVSYVVAFRQVSVPIGGLLGVIILGERALAARAAGIALIVAGLVIVALG